MMPKANALLLRNQLMVLVMAVVLLQYPVLHTWHGDCERTREEQHTSADWRTHALRQDELVVLGRQRRHHESKHVQASPGEEEMSWAVIVE